VEAEVEAEGDRGEYLTRGDVFGNPRSGTCQSVYQISRYRFSDPEGEHPCIFFVLTN
jgi:hypothetical protein